MRRKRLILSVVLLLGAFAAVSAQRVKDIMGRLYAQPERVYNMLVEGQGDSIIALGNAQFKVAAKAEMFNGIVPALEAQLGKFREVQGWTSVPNMQSMQVYTRDLVFEHYSIPLIVSFDAKNELAGLAFGAPKVIDKTQMQANEREITIETDGLRMPGLLTLPANGKEKYPCVILVHGSGPANMNETVGGHKPFLDLAEGLSKRGIAVIRYDKRTLVHKSNYVPAGKKSDYDTETVDDALSAVALARAMSDICPDSIYIIGHSLGAMLAPRIAGRAGKNVAGIITMAAPARKMRELLIEQVAYISNISQDSARVQVDAVMGTLPPDYIAMDNTYFSVDVAKTLNIPMLFLQGERDYQVTSTDYSLWQKAIGARSNVSMKQYPKLNHLFTEGEGASTPAEYNEEKHIPDYVLDDIAAFIRKGSL